MPLLEAAMLFLCLAIRRFAPPSPSGADKCSSLPQRFVALLSHCHSRHFISAASGRSGLLLHRFAMRWFATPCRRTAARFYADPSLCFDMPHFANANLCKANPLLLVARLSRCLPLQFFAVATQGGDLPALAVAVLGSSVRCLCGADLLRAPQFHSVAYRFGATPSRISRPSGLRSRFCCPG